MIASCMVVTKFLHRKTNRERETNKNMPETIKPFYVDVKLCYKVTDVFQISHADAILTSMYRDQSPMSAKRHIVLV